MQTIRICLGAALAFSSAIAAAQTSVSAEDQAAIQALVSRYPTALGTCDAQGFADLFAPETGVFASGFRGQVAGRERLMALVESERHCQAPRPEGGAPRPGGNAPTVAVQADAKGVFGTVDLGNVGQYQDRYVKTPQGWRFASRTVVITPEKAAGLDAEQMLAIQALSRDVKPVDHYEVGDNGVRRFLSSGVVILAKDGKVGGRVYLADGSHYEDVYEQTQPGVWRIASRELVPAKN